MIINGKFVPVVCNHCGESKFTWYCQPYNKSNHIVDGRLTMHDIGVRFFLGCDECSETLMIVSGDAVAELLTESMYDK